MQENGCSEIVTLALVHISDDMKHDSFLSRAAHNLTFKYLAELGLPLQLIIQFCDNCAAQYKSRRPFVELSKSPLEIIRVFFVEKHGKSHADGLFSHLKTWMSYQIKTRKFIVKDTHDFFTYCRDFYQTPRRQGCQHYRVEFQFIRPSDVRRHHDADLDHAVAGTQELYSVRNTLEPLTLKVRSVPCLCPACIADNGECQNAPYTDPWQLIKLVPQKGANLKKYQKRKHPAITLLDRGEKSDKEASSGSQNIAHLPKSTETPKDVNDENAADSDDELEPIKIEFDDKEVKQMKQRQINTTEVKNREKIVTDHVTDWKYVRSKNENKKVTAEECTWKNINEEIKLEDFVSTEDTDGEMELVEICQQHSKEVELGCDNFLHLSVTPELPNVVDFLSNKNLPEDVIWKSILSAFESCTDFIQLKKLTEDIEQLVPIIDECVQVYFCPGVDVPDNVAQCQIPPDGPTSLKAVQTDGDGNACQDQ